MKKRLPLAFLLLIFINFLADFIYYKLGLTTLIDTVMLNILLFTPLSIAIGFFVIIRPLNIKLVESRRNHKDLVESIKENAKLIREKDLILKEVHHRIKNNMNIIISLLSLQINSSKNEEAIIALEDASGRILSMAILYDKLYRNNSYNNLSIKDYLNSVLNDFKNSFQVGRNLEIIEEIEDVVVETKIIQTIGIIINELLSNIIKYAFDTVDEKKIISILVKKVNEDLLIEIQDNGKGIPEGVTFENSSGFGLSLVNNLVQQLKGTVRLSREHGTKITMLFTNIHN